MVRGIQSHNISACVKHFCCNNKETNRKSSDSRVSERALREIYLKGFEIVVKESDVWAVMTAYNLLNGTYTSENRDLLTAILREEWGFDGLVLTDWDNLAEHYREVLAGNDLRMPNGNPKRLQAALAEGLITRADLEISARRVLEFLLKLD
jgi:beta-glucosidase